MIDNILHYIQRHFAENLSLENLAAEANYSPYHFHRLFRQHTGEPPKQYLIRLRLEKATKELLFYPKKSVYAIAMDCGFSSQSVFARAFRSRYNITAEQYRTQAIKAIKERTEAITEDVMQYPVTVARLEKFHIACELLFLNNTAAIIDTFRRLHSYAAAHDLLRGTPEYYGVFLDSPFTTSLDKCRYLTGIRIRQEIKEKECRQLGGITVAQIPVLGNYEILTDYAVYVKQRWVPDSGYEIIQGVPGFERFTEMDFNKPYEEHYRTICVGIQPK
ncbi:helix-turn-helix domain-containing protein [Chitinophagaceae bacterium MMS25-I14]